MRHARRLSSTISAALCGVLWCAVAADAEPAARLRVARFVSDSRVELVDGDTTATVGRGERFGAWTLVEIVPGASRAAVLEDFSVADGRIVFVDTTGVRMDLPKSLEPTAARRRASTVGC
jgi:hypothetical protein